jgi:hypothetical protein
MRWVGYLARTDRSEMLINLWYEKPKKIKKMEDLMLERKTLK